MSDVRVGIAELATLFNVTEKAVRDWISAGLPTLVQGRQGRGHKTLIELRKAVAWYFRSQHEHLALVREKTRLAGVQARRGELAEARERGDLLDRAEAVRFWQSAVVALRQRLRSIPAQLAADVGTVETHRVLRAALTQAIDTALAEIASEPFAAQVAAQHVQAEAANDLRERSEG
ncbi:MAG TPA: hypothetical protein VMU40_02485 [Steroidobacteraceae bacterium]|nr:hypothetical protein [Steroidobacteraceae bacterium]